MWLNFLDPLQSESWRRLSARNFFASCSGSVLLKIWIWIVFGSTVPSRSSCYKTSYNVLEKEIGKEEKGKRGSGRDSLENHWFLLPFSLGTFPSPEFLPELIKPKNLCARTTKTLRLYLISELPTTLPRCHFMWQSTVFTEIEMRTQRLPRSNLHTSWVGFLSPRIKRPTSSLIAFFGNNQTFIFPSLSFSSSTHFF